jgi:preprotein translocase subunit YajC
MNLNSLFLLFSSATGTAQVQKEVEQPIMIIFIVLIIFLFYFFLIRPQQKKQKQMQDFRESLKRGDHIVTIGGIHGKIVDIQENTFTIEVEDGVKIKIDKAAVAVDPNQVKNKDKK